MPTEPHCVQKRETGVTLGDMVIKGWISILRYMADVVLGNIAKNTRHCNVGFQNEQQANASFQESCFSSQCTPLPI